MTIGAFETYLAKLAAPVQTVLTSRTSITTVAGRLYSGWLAGGSTTGAAPTTAAVPSRTIAGALSQKNATSGSAVQRLSRLQVSRASAGMLVLCDRLSHQGGLSGTATGAQTTNLPTAALTRYTDGVGVMLGLEIYTQIGTTATTITASYTDQDGNTGQTTAATAWGATGFREASRLVVLPLAAGDTGVRAVASVTAAATTGTAGNFGVTLFKPLVAIPCVGSVIQDHDALLGMSSQLVQILDDACLFWLYVSTTTTAGVLQASLEFIED